jgi:fucose permease
LGWQLPYGIAAGAVAASILVLLPQSCAVRSDEEYDPLAALRMLRLGAVAMGLVGIVLYVSTEVGLSGYVPAFMETNLGADKGTAANAVSILWAAMTVGRFICTALAHRFPAALFVVVLASGTAAASVVVALSRSVLTCYVGVGAAGLFMASIFAMVLADVGERVRGRAPTAFSVVVVGVGGGMLLFPPAMGWVAQAVGLRVALLAPSVLMIACAAVGSGGPDAPEGHCRSGTGCLFSSLEV